MTKSLPEFKDVIAAARRIDGAVTRTPLLRSVELDRITGGRIFVKPECLQLTGSFKLRGAYNRLASLTEKEKQKGVVAFSSGNHGQAVAYAAKRLAISAVIVMPDDAPEIKVEKTRSHGPEIVLYDRKKESREEKAAAIAKETGRVVVPSFDDPYIIAGQGTAALEAFVDASAKEITFHYYLVGTGGGGLLAGHSLVFRAHARSTKLYSVEPEAFDDHARSFKAGKPTPHEPNPKPTICDALLPPQPGKLTFAINKSFVAGGLSVTDDEVRTAMRFAFENLKLVVEPGGAVALAAVLAGKIDAKGRNVGLIITGGNVDASIFADVLKGA